MPRVIGVDIPKKKRLIVSLTYIFGVGPYRAQEIVDKLGLNPDIHAGDLSVEEITRINSVLQSDYVVEGDLRRKVQNDIKRLVSVHCYRGQRHTASLPVRGQRTRNNARTRKGKRKTVAGKKK